MRRLLIAGAVVAAAGLCATAHAADLPLIDAHIHYSHDAWEVIPPADAIAILRKAGLKRALISSSNDEGTQKLYQLAPDLVVPELRPYRRRGDLSTWVRDETVLAYIEERLGKYRYFGIGEFHVYGADADLPVVQRIVEWAKQRQLYLHAHSDSEAIERLFKQDPQARIIWAHSGFEWPEKVREMLRRHPRLWADLAFRNDHASGGKVAEGWREAFVEFPDRFLVGTDTFTPERWHYIEEHARYSRAWLADLPPDIAARIAWRNFEALLDSAPGLKP